MNTLNNLQFLNAGYCRQLAYWTGLRKISISKFQAVIVCFEHPVHGKYLIDTGYDECFWQATRNFPFRAYRWLLPTRVDRAHCLTAALHHAAITPSELSGIFLSHFHPDHIGGLSSLPPRIPLILRDQPLDHLRSLRPLQQLHHGFVPQLFDSVRESDIVSVREDQFVVQSLPIGLDIQSGTSVSECRKDWRVFDYWNDGSLLLVDLPGHSLGHTGYVFNTAQGAIFYIVDACWNVDVLRSGRQLPRLARRLQPNYQQYWETQQRLFRLTLEHPNLKMLACHCPRTQSYVKTASS